MKMCKAVGNNKCIKTIVVIANLFFLMSGCHQPNYKKMIYTGVPVSMQQADNGDGTYTNPVIQADYSDPDVVKVGDDFFMTASSFACSPGLPILHSVDLVNWQLISYASPLVEPAERYHTVQHGNGIWAPSLRYHKGEFFIFYGDPDVGIFMLKAKNVMGPWTQPYLVKEAKGWIDPCPFWDDDGRAYLVHGFAGSRSGIKSVLVMHEMTPDGTALLDDGVLVFDGHVNHRTVEGPKLYKRNGYYYILAPAGSVPTGWQLALRSKHINGPYEERIVLERGSTEINGPHQGGLIQLDNGESWFLHFQDQEAYGRMVHLQPVEWMDNWPLMGVENNGLREPVTRHSKPTTKYSGKVEGILNDEFNNAKISKLWQWHANPHPDWARCYPAKGVLRLYSQLYEENYRNLWDTPSLLLQKWPAREFEAVIKVGLHLNNVGERAGLLIMGLNYSALVVENQESGLQVYQATAINASKGEVEKVIDKQVVKSDSIYLKVKVKDGANCNFSYSLDGKSFVEVGEQFMATPGKWIGAKVGVFAQKKDANNDSGYIDIDWFRYN